MLEIRLLGQFHVQLDEKNIEITSYPVRGLLSYLAYYKNIRHSREKVAEIFWPDASLDIGRKYLRNALRQINKTLGSELDSGTALIHADKRSVWLKQDAVLDCDAATFTAESDSPPTIQQLKSELQLYGGDFLPGFFEDWVALERARCRAIFLRKIQALLDLLSQAEAWDEVIEWSERWIVLEKTAEPAFRSLMVAYAKMGDRVKVEEVFRRSNEVLRRELGIPPGEQTLQTYHYLMNPGEQQMTGKIEAPDALPDRWLGVPPNQKDPPSRLLESEASGGSIAPNSLVNGRYRLDEEIGRGFIGVVYRGFDNLLGRNVAIKMLRKEYLGAEGSFRLIKEAQTIAKINHPNIVTIYDAGEDQGNPFMVIEMLTGEALNARISKPIEEVYRIIHQICSALQQVHAYGIVHRDLKPENVMILPDGTIKIMDFGLAHYDASRITTEGEILGTIFYLAPEQAMGKTVDQRTDIYALGVLIYELVTGQLPFTGDTMVSVISQHLYADPRRPSELNPQIPEALDSFILRMMSKDPQDRPGSISQVLEELEKLERGEETGFIRTKDTTEAASTRTGAKLGGKIAGEGSSLSGVHLLLENWRNQGVELLDVASLALIHSSPPETVFSQEDALLLTRSVLNRQVELEPWLKRAVSEEDAACVLEKLLEEYPKPNIRMKIVKGLETLKTDHAAEILFRIATTDDAPTVRAEAALAAVRNGRKDQVVRGLIAAMSGNGDVSALAAFVAVMDEFGIPKEVKGYPRFQVAVNLLQRRIRAKGGLVWQQGLRCALGGGLFLAANGMAAPFYVALANPEAFRENLKVVTVPSWMIIGALGFLIIGGLQGFASGLAVGFADVIWREASRRNMRVIFGGLSGLVLGLYQILFTLIGATTPSTDPGIHNPVYLVYGILLGATITIVIPLIGHSPGLRLQLLRGSITAVIAAALTVPYAFLVYGEEAPQLLFSRVMVGVMLVAGIAFVLRRGVREQPV